MCTCAYCGAVYDDEVINEFGLCEKCEELRTSGELEQCDCCGLWTAVSLRDVIVAQGWRTATEKWCKTCVYDHAAPCDWCGELVKTSDMLSDSCCTSLCPNCASDAYLCESCGCYVSADDVCFVDDYAYCESCAPERSSVINDYGYKPYPDFKALADEVNPRYYGVELEVGGMQYESDCDEVAERLDVNYSSTFYMKHDCSITNYGFEIVSHPASIAYHRQFEWETVLTTLSESGMRSHNLSTCGLHVHADRKALKLERWILVDWFINKYKTFWSNIARRKPNHYADTRYNAGSDLPLKDVYAKDDGRYLLVNFENRNTVEFRLFRGTLRYGSFIGTLELVDALIEWAATCNIAHVMKVGAQAHFTTFVMQGDYKFAQEYLKYRGLVD